MKIRDVIKILKADGWYLVATEGSHQQYKHPVKKGRVTVPGNPGKDIAPGTWASVQKQAQLEEKQ